MPTLYEISDDLRAIEARLLESDGEITDADFEGWIEATAEARNLKLDGYAALMREIEARIAARLTESKRLKELAETDERALDRLRERLKWFFEVHGLDKVETARFRFGMVTNGGKLPLVIADGTQIADVADSFKRAVPAKWEFETVAIRQWLDSGNELPWAHYGERTRRLTIK
jgi:Siphovirus Gp157